MKLLSHVISLSLLWLNLYFFKAMWLTELGNIRCCLFFSCWLGRISFACLLGGCRELRDIDTSMIYGKNGALVQNHCIVLKSLEAVLVLRGPGFHRTKTIVGSISAAEQWWYSEPWRCWYKQLYEPINLFLLCWGKVVWRQKVWWTWLLMPGPYEDSSWLLVWALHANWKPGGGVTVSRAQVPAFILS